MPWVPSPATRSPWRLAVTFVELWNLMPISLPNSLPLREGVLHWGKRTYIMGVLNVTPDSFSDGGDFDTLHAAIQQASAMVDAGADIIDIGGQSTRPGAADVSLETERQRVLPVIEAIRQQSQVPISIDTMKSDIAREALLAGADMVNDVTGGTHDCQMLPTVAQHHAPVILMHMRGTPQTMQQLTQYDDVVAEVKTYLHERAAAAIAAGIDANKIILDPGIGFAKTYQQNLDILRQLPEFRALGYPLLVGVSRKSFIGKILNRPHAKERVWGTAAACTAAIATGACDILRVHDVAAMWDVTQVADAIYRNPK
jgi:dihydropteroate synthase